MTLDTQNTLDDIRSRIMELAENGILDFHPAGRELPGLVEQLQTRMDSAGIRRSLDERGLLGMIPVGVIRVGKDAVLSYVNQEFADMLGETVDQLTGKPIADLAASEDMEMLSSVINAMNQSGGRAEVEVVLKHPETGSRTFLMRITSLPGGHSGLIGVVEDQGRTSDLFRELERERKRNESSRVLAESLLECSPDPVALYDDSFKLRYASPAFRELFGWSVEIAKGKTLPECPEGEQMSSQLKMEEVLESGEPVRNFVTRRKTANGVVVDVCVSISRFHDATSGKNGLLLVFRDMQRICENPEAIA